MLVLSNQHGGVARGGTDATRVRRLDSWLISNIGGITEQPTGGPLGSQTLPSVASVMCRVGRDNAAVLFSNLTM